MTLDRMGQELTITCLKSLSTLSPANIICFFILFRRKLRFLLNKNEKTLSLKPSRNATAFLRRLLLSEAQRTEALSIQHYNNLVLNWEKDQWSTWDTVLTICYKGILLTYTRFKQAFPEEHYPISATLIMRSSTSRTNSTKCGSRLVSRLRLNGKSTLICSTNREGADFII